MAGLQFLAIATGIGMAWALIGALSYRVCPSTGLDYEDHSVLAVISGPCYIPLRFTMWMCMKIMRV